MGRSRIRVYGRIPRIAPQSGFIRATLAKTSLTDYISSLSANRLKELNQAMKIASNIEG
jgi:hypothetical protein